MDVNEEKRNKQLWAKKVELAKKLLLAVVQGHNRNGGRVIPEDQYFHWMKVLAEAPAETLNKFSQHPEHYLEIENYIRQSLTQTN